MIEHLELFGIYALCISGNNRLHFLIILCEKAKDFTLRVQNPAKSPVGLSCFQTSRLKFYFTCLIQIVLRSVLFIESYSVLENKYIIQIELYY